MKKFFLTILSLALCTVALTGCSIEVNTSGNGSSSVSDSSASDESSNNDSVGDSSEENDELTESSSIDESSSENSDSSESESDSSSKSENSSSSAANDEPVDVDVEFSFDKQGTVILEADEKTDDKTMLAAAQVMFELACKTDWSYHVGCPYSLDYDSYVENDFGWRFYRVSDSSITSFKDVTDDYYEVFSESYGNNLDELYIEENGNVYALNGERGKDIYYTGSKVTSIDKTTDSEITFTVENYYSGDDFEQDSDKTETAEFSVVTSGNSWRVGKFSLPY